MSDLEQAILDSLRALGRMSCKDVSDELLRVKGMLPRKKELLEVSPDPKPDAIVDPDTVVEKDAEGNVLVTWTPPPVPRPISVIKDAIVEEKP